MPQPRRNPKYTEDHGPSTLRHIQQSKTYPESSRVNKHCNKEINRTFTVEKMVYWFTKEYRSYTNLHFVLLGRAFLQISNPSGHKIQPEMVIYFPNKSNSTLVLCGSNDLIFWCPKWQGSMTIFSKLWFCIIWTAGNLRCG